MTQEAAASGRRPEITAREMCAEMVAEDLKTVQRHALIKNMGLSCRCRWKMDEVRDDETFSPSFLRTQESRVCVRLRRRVVDWIPYY